MTSEAKLFPYYANGTVVAGFQRGSTELGMPTANFPNEVVEKLPPSFNQGVYYGWAQVDNGPVYKMSMSIGTNPYYKNQKKTMETYIMNEFENNFYGKELKVVVVGYLRPMKNYETLTELVEAIKKDVKQADILLDKIENKMFKNDVFFIQNCNGPKSKV